EAGGKGGKVHVLDRGDTAAAGQDTLPGTRHVHAQRREHTHASDDDASARHYDFLILRIHGIGAGPRPGLSSAMLKKSRTPLQAVRLLPSETATYCWWATM